MMSQPQDLDLSRLWTTLRRALPLILAVAALLAVASYLISRAQPARYQATASLAALPAGSSNSLVSTSLVSAPPVPPAVVEAALHGAGVTQAALQRLTRAPVSAAQLAGLRARFAAEAQGAQPRAVTLSAQVDQDQVGLYAITASAPDPAVAREVANAFMAALLDWDRQRALDGVRRAQLNLSAQRDNLTARLAEATGEVERRSLIGARGNVLQALAQLAVLNQTVTGTLSALSPATTPSRPAAPRPLRDALIVLAFALFAGLLIASALDALQRRVRTLRDLEHLPVSTVGTLPVIQRLSRAPADLLPRVRQSVFGEQMEFVRLALQMSLDQPGRPSVLVVSSARPGEGKSTVVAGLANSLAASGQRVLVFDADVYKPRQRLIWDPAASAPQRPATGLAQLWPELVPNVTLAVPEAHHLDAQAFTELIASVAPGHDVVLVDTPPLLSVAETLALAARADGLLLVVNSDSPLTGAEQAVQEAGRLGVRTLGVVLNRARAGRVGPYYSYMPGESAR